MRGLVIFAFVAFAGCASAAPGRWAPDRLNDWVGDEFEPKIVGTLATHPRFAGETIRVVTVRDGQFGRGNNLALSVRNRLERTLLDDERIDIASIRKNRSDTLDCNPDAGIAYYLAVEIKAGRGPDAVADFRIYDVAENEWVSGFGATWRGELTRGERRAVAKRTIGASDQGRRQNPFASSQEDIAAERLARDLACQLRASAVDEQTAAIATGDASPFTQLVAANISRFAGVRTTRSNAALALAVNEHPIDGGLAQVWAVVDGVDSDETPVSFSASVYMRKNRSATAKRNEKPGRLPQIQPVASEMDSIGLPQPTLALRAVVPSGMCHRADRWHGQVSALRPDAAIRPGDCFAIEVPTAFRAFVLNRDTRGRWSRVYPSACSASPRRSGSNARFPGGDGAFRWEGRAGIEIFQVVTVDDPVSAAAIARVLDHLPDACGKARKAAGTSWQHDFASVLDAIGGGASFGEFRVQHATPGDISQVARR